MHGEPDMGRACRCRDEKPAKVEVEPREYLMISALYPSSDSLYGDASVFDPSPLADQVARALAASATSRVRSGASRKMVKLTGEILRCERRRR